MVKVMSRASHSTSTQVLTRVAVRQPLTAGDAAAIASWYQTPSGHGAVFAAFASGLAVDRFDLLDAIAAELPHTAPIDHPALTALARWTRAQ